MKRKYSLLQKVFAGIAAYAFVVPTLAVAPYSKTAKPLTEEQKILHLLNRLSFGARPGDVEKVKAVGLQKYI